MWDSEELILNSSKILKSEMNWWESLDMFSNWFSSEKNVSNIDDQRSDFWWDIELIEWVEKNDRFAMINRYDFESSLEQIEWFQCRCSEKRFHWYNDSESDFWFEHCSDIWYDVFLMI